MDFYALQEDIQISDVPAQGGGSGQAFVGGRRVKDGKQLYESYVILGELGHGAYGTVHKANHKTRDGLFAIKHIDKRRAGEKGLSEVMSEVETLSLLSHRNIVRLEDVYMDSSNLWIVMEFVPGSEMAQALRREGRFSEVKVRQLAVYLILAVDYIHSKGIVHRDLKPANCLIDEGRTDEDEMDLKLADFGFAVMVGEEQLLTTFCGTQSYMAPEVLLDQNYGKAVDMWSVGCILYLMLCGELPFQGTAATPLADAIILGQFSFAAPVWASISVGAKDLVSKLLVADPQRRLTAAEALKHFWVSSARERIRDRRTEVAMYGSCSDSDADGGAVLSPKSADYRRRKRRLKLRGAMLCVVAAHRLVYAAKLRGLRRDGIDYPLMRSFAFLVGRHYEPPTPVIMARGMCPGNVKALLQLTAMLEAAPGVETFDLSHNGIDSLDVLQMVAKVAGAHPALTTLNLEENPIPSLAGRTLHRLARTSPRIRTMNLQRTTLSSDMLQQISAALKEAEKRRVDAAAAAARAPPTPAPGMTRTALGKGAAIARNISSGSARGYGSSAATGRPSGASSGTTSTGLPGGTGSARVAPAGLGRRR